MSGIRLTFELCLLSDYHIGSGHRLGVDVDSALLRDADQRPVLRGTTIGALVRDGLHRLLLMPPFTNAHPHTTGQGDPSEGFCTGDSLCWECRIFGSPRNARSWLFSSARLEDSPRVQAPVNAGWGAQTATRVRVQPRQRRAEQHKLFAREEGDRRLKFQFTATCRTDDTDNRAEAELLVAAARMVRRLGAGRRRGRGECVINLVQAVDAQNNPILLGSAENRTRDWLDAFAHNWIAQPMRQPSSPTERAHTDLPILDPVTEDALPAVCIRVIARAEEPLLIAQRAEAGNEFETLFSIPGSVLLGALAQRVAAKLDLARADACQLFAELFYRDRIIFPFAHPATAEETMLYPTIPAPRNLLTCKTQPGYADASKPGHGVWTTADATRACVLCGTRADQAPSSTNCAHVFAPICAVCGERLDAIGNYLPLQIRPAEFTTARRAEMHQRVNPHTGRVAEGDLFGYVALEAGQYFTGNLFCDESAWHVLCELAGVRETEPLELRLGKATTRGYGLTRLVFTPEPDPDRKPWTRVPIEERVLDRTQVQMTLLTDAIIVDLWGRFAARFDAEWLALELQLENQVLALTEPSVATREVDSFNATHGLPRWRDLAIVAGSSVKLHLAPSVTIEQLRQVEERGIGLRRGEGFGRIAFNHPLYRHGEQLGAAGISIPPALDPGAANQSSIDREVRFRRDWSFDLETVSGWDCFQYSQFGGVARLLRAERTRGHAALLERLARDGDRLGPIGNPRSVIGAAGMRRDKSWFDEKGKAGLAKLRELLDTLAATSGEDAGLWRIGVEMIAERIAQQVRIAKEKGR